MPTTSGRETATNDPGSEQTAARVPLVDLAAQHAAVADEVSTGWARVMDRSAFVLGEEVEAFEESFAGFCGVRHCVGVGNGTDALELTFRSLRIGPSDEVIVPANSFVASAAAVARTGATPVFVDAMPDTLLIDVEQASRRLGPRTRAILAVHLFGQPAPVEELTELLGARGAVVEDAAQAQGASRNGRRAGALGRVAATSFYPGKNLGAYGDGGAVLTDDDELAVRVRRMRNHGGERKYEHVELGFNSRLDTLQAVVLSAKLRRLDAWNESRREAADRYDRLLSGIPGVVRPVTLPGNRHAWHLYVIQVPGRDHVLQSLHGAGIGAGIHYPEPIHLLPAFAHLGYRPGDLPVAEAAATTILSLPIYPEITPDQQARVAEALGEAVARVA